MKSEGHALASLAIAEAKALRMRFGDAKYGRKMRQVSMLAEAYIEAIDLLNYIDLAEKAGELDNIERATLYNNAYYFAELLRQRVTR